MLMFGGREKGKESKEEGRWEGVGIEGKEKWGGVREISSPVCTREDVMAGADGLSAYKFRGVVGLRGTSCWDVVGKVIG
jgi:hypothetical protein